ncbi:MAG TPA: MBL fold metallo-hydrolase [Acetobacteraceae bacterium]|nr:MBL fold metallo-hydrolase [Acetobacteraceae bacterium]
MNKSFALGDLTLTRIVEQQQPLFDIFEFFPAVTPELFEENRSWLEPEALDPATRKLILCVQSYLVRTPHHTILVDSCVGNDKPRLHRPFWHMMKSKAFLQDLAAAGVSPADIDFVMCTHLHVDHVGWNTHLESGRWVPTFPNARYLFSERELAYWTEQHAREPIACIADSVLPILDARQADLVRSDHVLNDHVRLMPTPGHTPDHFCVALGSGRDDAIVTGDLIHSPIQMRYPEISYRADFDPKQSAASRRAFLERYCETATLCCPAHFPAPSVSRVSRWGDGFRCTPVSA